MREENGGLTVVIALFAIFAMICMVFTPFITRDTVVATIDSKERVVSKSGDTIDSKYLVFTGVETLENTDCFILLKFNSSDLYGKLKEHHTYKFNVYGWRVPFLSWYRNIINFKEQSDGEARPLQE